MAAASTAAVLFGCVTVLVATRYGPVVRLDVRVDDALHRYALRHGTFVTAMKTVSALGTSHMWWIVFVALAAWQYYRRSLRLALFVLVTGVASSLLNTVVKSLVDRPRPQLAHPVATAAGSSFPSGHAQAAIVGCAIVLLVVLPVAHPRLRPWLLGAGALIALVIGFSRLALGVHFLSDVIGGYLLGVLWTLGLAMLFRVPGSARRQPPSGAPATARSPPISTRAGVP